MDFFITFIEGITTFISPCLLPMLPVYLAYFAGDQKGNRLVDSLGFLCGFTFVFISLGALMGTLGAVMQRWEQSLNIFCGVVIIIFGLHTIGCLHINILDRTLKPSTRISPVSFCSAILFGVVFALGWTPCVGPFLSAALILAARTGSTMRGMGLLLAYSLGLGLPFVICAIAINQLEGALGVLKAHARMVEIISGVILIGIGILVVSGFLGTLVAWLSL